MPPPGLPLASLLALFGCLWAPFWRLLAPFGFLWAPLELSLALLSSSSPADSSGTSFLASFGCLWAPFWRLRAPFWAAFRHRTCCKKRPAFRHWQHSVKGLKWYILSKRWKTQVVHPVKTLRKIKTQVVDPVETLRRLKWYILLIASGREILPRSRFCRERAENPPRTSREPAV